MSGRPGPPDTDLLRVAWGALARIVLGEAASTLFGCTSFAGTDPQRYADGFALLGERYLGPAQVRPRRRAEEVVQFPKTPPNLPEALRQLPPLLRAYVGMGGWTSDHAVVDRDLGTIHVFTAVEIARIPTGRVAALHTLAAR